MNLDMMVVPKKHSIRLTLKNSTGADLKLHSYVSSASPLSQLPDMLIHSDEGAFDELDFELPQDSEHGIWLCYRYMNNETKGFDVCIWAIFSKTQDIDMNTDVYYIDGQEEKKIQSHQVTYAMCNIGETPQYQVKDSIFDEDVERENDTVFSAHVQYDTANTDGWDLCASIEIQFLMTLTP
jgi:hypothetical protein